MLFSLMSLTTLLLSTSALARPAPALSAASAASYSSGLYHLEITGLPKTQTHNETIYIGYGYNNYVGVYNFEATTDKAYALRFEIQDDNSLRSTIDYGMEVQPLLEPSYTAGAMKYTPYNSTLAAKIKGTKPNPKTVVGDVPNWKSWLLCENQYGTFLSWAATTYNVSASYEPCFLIGFVAKQ